MKLHLELKCQTFIITAANEDFIDCLKQHIPHTLVAQNQIVFSGDPIFIDLDLHGTAWEAIDNMHSFISDFGICEIRAVEDGFNLVIG